MKLCCLFHRLVVCFLVLVITGFVTSPETFAQILFQEDFEGETVGLQPSSFSVNGPATNTGATDNPPVAGTSGPLGAVVVPFGSVSNLAGTGNALRIYDHDSDSSVNLTQDITGTGLMRWDLSFSSDAFTGTNGNSFLRIAFGRLTMNPGSSSDGRVMGRVTIARTSGSNTRFEVRNNTTDTTVLSDFTLLNSHQISIFANTDDSASSNYNFSGGQSLASNTYDVFLDGALVADDFAFRSGSTSGLNDIETIGFATGSSQTGPDWIIDDITVSAIPEPSALCLLSLATVFVIIVKRKRVCFAFRSNFE
ncbi:MAG: PEP-CTERM sorting domain-containing protein [Verrucomicrobiota bacterium]